MENHGPPPTDPLVRKEPPFEWATTSDRMPRRVETAIPPEKDPDIAMWRTVEVSIWPFTGAPTVGVWPQGWLGIDNTGTPYVCTVGGAPGTWEAVGSGGGGAPSIPIADPTGIATETQTPDPIRGTGSAKWVAFPSDGVVMAWGLAGDAFPRIMMAADPTDFAFFMLGDGTFDPATHDPLIGIGTDGTNLDLFGPVLVANALILQGVPTADPHVVGQVWSNSGVLTLSAG